MVRIVVVAVPGAGKTTILKRLLDLRIQFSDLHLTLDLLLGR